MRLLITRPEPDAGKLKQLLEQRGHEAMIEALLDVRYIDEAIDPAPYRAVLATSANGVRALERNSGFSRLRQLTLFAVGPATAREGKRAGFKKVLVGGGNVDKLTELVSSHLPADGAPLLHISGKAAAGDLKGELEQRGFKVERFVLYEAVKATSFTPGTAKAFIAGEIDGVLLYSPRTAAIFSDIVRNAKLEGVMDGVDFYCLSEAVGNNLETIKGINILVAGEPNQEVLLNLL